MRYIPIKTCDGCPHKEHMGGFGRVAYVPRCGRTGTKLGYKAVTGGLGVIAAYDKVIPEWCPLPELEHEDA